MTLRRLDAELTRRGLARSREHAQVLIEDGSVLVRGSVAHKAATRVDAGDPIVVSAGTQHSWVSRGALKLIGALDAFAGLNVTGRYALDAGASTGGFTEVLLSRGAVGVIAADVGYGQIAWQLREDPRVHLLERTNVRHLEVAHLPWQPDLITGDLSFISLGVVLPALLRCMAAEGDLCLLVKPQFEAGREHVKRGVVRDPEQHGGALARVAASLQAAGCAVMGVTDSPLLGPAGNREFFLWARRAARWPDEALAGASLDSAILDAVSEVSRE
ncbi:MAG: TlyA family RNA methyltransferase [Actinomycetales bacterium]